MKLGISALLFNLDEALELCEHIKEINHIEIGIDNLEDILSLNEYKDKFINLNLSLGIHLPMELNPCENIKYISQSWIDFIKKMDLNLEGFNIEYFNMHLGYALSERLYKNRTKYLDNSIEFLKELLKECNKTITIENTYSKGGDFSNVGYIYEDFKYIFNKVENKRLCFCYDTGHNLISNSNYIENLQNKFEILHLSDNDGIKDRHLGIGRGILSEDEIKKIINFSFKYLILEIDHEHVKETIDKLNKIKKEV